MTGPVQATSSDDVYEAPEDAYWDVIGSERVHILDSADAVRLAGCARRAVVDVARDRLRADIVTALRERIGDPESSKWDDDRDAQWAQGYLDAADDIEAKVIAP